AIESANPTISPNSVNMALRTRSNSARSAGVSLCPWRRASTPAVVQPTNTVSMVKNRISGRSTSQSMKRPSRAGGCGAMTRFVDSIRLLPPGGSVKQIGLRLNRFPIRSPFLPPFPHRLIFVRHGETPYNAENRLQGQRDIPLGSRGRDQASTVDRTLRARIGSEIDRLDATDAFVVSHGGVARALMTLIAGVPGAVAASAPIVQGRAIVFEKGGYDWI